MNSEHLSVPIGNIVCPEDKLWSICYIKDALKRNILITGMQHAGKTTLARKYINNLICECKELSIAIPKVVVLESLDIEDRPSWKKPVNFIDESLFHTIPLYIDESAVLPAINIWKVPDGFEPRQWLKIVVDMFCHTFHLLQRSRDTLIHTVTELYQDAGVWYAKDSTAAQALSSKVSFESIIAFIKKRIDMDLYSAQKDTFYTKECDQQLYEALCCSRNPLFGKIFTHEQGKSLSDVIQEGINVFKGKYQGAEIHHFLYNCIMMYTAKREGNDDMMLVIDNIASTDISLIDDAVLNKNPCTHFIVLTTGRYMCDTSCLDSFDYIIAGRTPAVAHQDILKQFSQKDLSEHNVIRCAHSCTPTGVFAKIPSKNTDDEPEGIKAGGII